MTKVRRNLGGMSLVVATLAWGGACSDSPSTAADVTDGSAQAEAGAANTGRGPVSDDLSGAVGDAGLAAGDEGEGQDPPAGASADPLVYAPCPAEQRIGRFVVHSLPQNADRAASTELSGFVRDGVRPADVDEVLLEAEEEGCRLVSGPDLLCDPRCAFDELCTADGSCTAAPTSQDAGPVSITGTTREFRLVPNSANNYLPEPGTMVDYAPYEEGAELSLSAAGAEVPPFELRARGVEPLTFGDSDLEVAMDSPLLLLWEAPKRSDSAVRVRVELDIAHHGGVDAQVVCDVADTGSLQVPAALINGLLEQGVAGFPAVTLARRSVSSAMLEAGCLEFVVDSEISQEVSIPGLLSCGTDDDCPAGMLCKAENLTCGE